MKINNLKLLFKLQNFTKCSIKFCECMKMNNLIFFLQNIKLPLDTDLYLPYFQKQVKSWWLSKAVTRRWVTRVGTAPHSLMFARGDVWQRPLRLISYYNFGDNGASGWVWQPHTIVVGMSCQKTKQICWVESTRSSSIVGWHSS